MMCFVVVFFGWVRVSFFIYSCFFLSISHLLVLFPGGFTQLNNVSLSYWGSCLLVSRSLVSRSLRRCFRIPFLTLSFMLSFCTF